MNDDTQRIFRNQMTIMFDVPIELSGDPRIDKFFSDFGEKIEALLTGGLDGDAPTAWSLRLEQLGIEYQGGWLN